MITRFQLFREMGYGKTPQIQYLHEAVHELGNGGVHSVTTESGTKSQS
jgi:hypothetical protein